MLIRDVINRRDKENCELGCPQSIRSVEEIYVPSRLREANGPRDLLEALLNSMTSYVELYNQGWQLRNISNLNVRLNHVFGEAHSLNKDESHPYGLKHCRGILIDSGDSEAVKWEEAREPGTHRSVTDTLPFISQDMLDAMSWPSNTTHTALDDLESFTWVLVWECLHKGKSLNLLSNWDLKSLDGFKDDYPQHLASFKGDFLSTCKDGGRKWRGSFLSPFKDLLARWAGIRWEAIEQMADLEDIRHDSDSVTQVLKDIGVLCSETGHKYVRAGLEHLPKLHESWAPRNPT
ncbi:hypothetical protein B0H15DRAFT_418695 [Mycena belliarum]|uniref:Fungal-type protein kinase domain-containing protein n=1 Tax=Mycena belliarum TaxID=1033014 RepID=A0AAD6TY67_9AGAR|nr:hypothetical protein B0H15DRAFT_418695 [Mycena belliae]